MANLSDGELKSAWLIVVNKCHLKYERALFGHFQLGICLVSAKLSLPSSVVQSISVGRGHCPLRLLCRNLECHESWDGVGHTKWYGKAVNLNFVGY